MGGDSYKISSDARGRIIFTRDHAVAEASSRRFNFYTGVAIPGLSGYITSDVHQVGTRGEVTERGRTWWTVAGWAGPGPRGALAARRRRAVGPKAPGRPQAPAGPRLGKVDPRRHSCRFPVTSPGGQPASTVQHSPAQPSPAAQNAP